MAESQTTTKEALEPCPWCRATPEQTDLAPSQRYRINHEPTCWLVGRLTDLRGREGRSHFIALRDVDTWNGSRVSASVAPAVDDTEPLTDAQVDAWLDEHKNDPVDPARANRVEWLFRKKLAASIVDRAKEWLRSYNERIARGGKGAQDMERLYGEEAAFHREVIRAVETLALEPPAPASTLTVAPQTKSCGFCGKSDQEVKALIQAPVGYICEECVAICAGIIERNGVAPQEQAKTTESPILAFESWLLRWVADHGRKLTPEEYGIAYAAFIAAHPGASR